MDAATIIITTKTNAMRSKEEILRSNANVPSTQKEGALQAMQEYADEQSLALLDWFVSDGDVMSKAILDKFKEDILKQKKE